MPITQLGQASLVRKVTKYRGDMEIYRLEPPYMEQRHVLLSKIDTGRYTEILAFPSTEEDKTSSSDIYGRRGINTFEEALREMGYQLTDAIV